MHKFIVLYGFLNYSVIKITNITGLPTNKINRKQTYFVNVPLPWKVQQPIQLNLPSSLKSGITSSRNWILALAQGLGSFIILGTSI